MWPSRERSKIYTSSDRTVLGVASVMPGCSPLRCRACGCRGPPNTTDQAVQGVDPIRECVSVQVRPVDVSIQCVTTGSGERGFSLESGGFGWSCYRTLSAPV